MVDVVNAYPLWMWTVFFFSWLVMFYFSIKVPKPLNFVLAGASILVSLICTYSGFLVGEVLADGSVVYYGYAPIFGAIGFVGTMLSAVVFIISSVLLLKK